MCSAFMEECGEKACLSCASSPLPSKRILASYVKGPTSRPCIKQDLQRTHNLSEIMLQQRTRAAILPTVLIVIAWILVVLNVLVIVLSPHYARQRSLGHGIFSIALGYLIRLTTLGVAVFALSLAAWLHYKQRYAKTDLIVATIIVILTASLMYPPKPSSPTIAPAAQTVESPDDSPAQTNQVQQATPFGRLVTGIVFSTDKPAAVIGSELLYEGDITQGVTIVKIYKDKVRFEKDGHIWTQGVQDKPGPYWNDPTRRISRFR